MRRIRILAVLTTAVGLAAGVVAGGTAQAETRSITSVSSVGTTVSTAPAAPVAQEAAPDTAAAVATKILWTRRSTTVIYGTRALLEGQVATSNGAVPNATVALYAKPAGNTSWTSLGTKTTSADTGLFTFEHVPSRITDYRVVYSGDATYSGSESTVRVNVRRKVTTAMWKNGDGTFTMSGSVSPNSSGKSVRLHRKTCSSCSWKIIKYSTVSSYSKFRFKMSGPSTRTTWYFRSYVPGDSKFLTGYSAIWTITRY